MKTKFKFLNLLAVALLVGFSSCSNDEDNAVKEEGPKKSVTLTVSKPSTYTDEVTAVGVVPDITDVKVFFVGVGVIQKVETMTVGEVGTAKTYTDVPGATTDVIVIANSTAVVTDPALSTILANQPLSSLNSIMFIQANQTNPKTAVNVYGKATITGTAGNLTASVNLRPAISRIEIKGVKSKAAATIPLTAFDLTGIYINNTYVKLGTDYETVPTPLVEILSYGSNDAAWTNGSYPARYNDIFTAFVNGTDYQATGRWSYYVMPVKAGNGTTINGQLQSSVPHVILEISNAKAAGHTFPAKTYITIRDIKVSGTSLTQLLPGYVYSLSAGAAADGSIEIGGENLTPKPETNPLEDITVTATVKAWENVPVDPNF